MIEQLFLETPAVDVWPSFEERILPLLKRNTTIHSYTYQSIDTDTYDNYFRSKYEAFDYISIETVHNLIRLQLDGRSGHLLVDGRQNVFFCEALDDAHPGYALQAQWLQREHDKKFRWQVLGWSLSIQGIWPDWGTFRPAGTRFFGTVEDGSNIHVQVAF